MMIAAAIVVTYIATSALAYHLLVSVHRQFARSIGSHLTNGDVVFCSIIAIIPYVGLAVATFVTLIEGYGDAGAKWASKRFDAEDKP